MHVTDYGKVGKRYDVDPYIYRSSKGVQCATLVEQHSEVRSVVFKQTLRILAQ